MVCCYKYVAPTERRALTCQAGLVVTQEFRDGLSDLLWDLIHRIVFLTFEHDESTLGQSIH